ncbi:cyclin-dependent kinase inhibitor 1Ba [Pempheris klunzingeri]|uniref:cyclin-dependent kinase inhibitor 1Ba n=1 Tax=Pempheris klunzingeri TaxID=3127111 RepID=UPI00397FA6AD
MCNKMSDVRLSNASPTLERVDARQPDNVRPPVRRNLFGTPDREEVRRYMTASIQESVQAFTEEYNFDPENDTPLAPRRFEWQRISNAAEFYHRPPHGSRRPQREVDLPGESDRQDAEGSSGGQPDRHDTRKRRSRASGPCSSECPSKRLHTNDEDDDDDDEDQSDGAAGQAVKAAEERASRPESSAEVQ